MCFKNSRGMLISSVNKVSTGYIYIYMQCSLIININTPAKIRKT